MSFFIIILLGFRILNNSRSLLYNSFSEVCEDFICLLPTKLLRLYWLPYSIHYCLLYTDLSLVLFLLPVCYFFHQNWS